MPLVLLRRSRRPRSARAAAAIAFRAALGLAGLTVVAVAAACTPGGSATRGFGSRQILAARDPAPGLRSFSADASALYLARPIAGVTTMTGISPPYDRTLLDFASGAETPIAQGVLAATLLPGAPGQARSLVMTRFPSDDAIPAIITDLSSSPLTATFLDEGSGATFDIPYLYSTSADDFPLLGATRSDPISVVRALPGDKPTTWIGPAESLTPITAGYTGIEGRDRSGFIGTFQSIDATDTTAATDAASGGRSMSFRRFPFDGSPSVEVVPAVLGPHVVPSVAGVVAPDPDTGILPVGATSGMICPLTWTSATPPPCLLLYDRTFVNQANHAFIRVLDDAREIELPGVAFGTSIYSTAVSPSGSSFFWSSAAATRDLWIFNWNLASPNAQACTVAAAADPTQNTLLTVSAWKHVGDGFAVIAEVQDHAGQTQAWTLVTSDVGQPCVPGATGTTRVGQLVFSPGDTWLARLESDPAEMSSVHLSNPDGTGDWVVATGASFFQIDFLDEQRLLLWHSNTDGYSLSWLDLAGGPAGGPAPEHPIADRVAWGTRGSWVWLASRWLLIGDSVSPQDGTYSVSLIDSLNGNEQIISRGVVDFRVPWTTPPPDATDLPVAYVVRGRSASGQDGIWVAHLPIADFPPRP